MANAGQGSIIISDVSEGAQFSGALGERDRNQGSRASTKQIAFAPGTRLAVMLVSDGTMAEALSGEKTALFSIAAYNSSGQSQLGQAAENILAMEDIAIGQGDSDFNDVVFRLSGATSNVQQLQGLIAPEKNWLNNPTATAFLQPAIDIGTIDIGTIFGPTTPVQGEVATGGNVPKFTDLNTEAEIIAAGAKKVTLGTQTIYIGTNQVTSINQAPILRSFAPVNPGNNWTRTDLEDTGTDGRGLGVFWSGSALYGIFSVDGTQNNGGGNDFRDEASGATQAWLRSYGQGGGSKVAVIAQLDPASGARLKAAHLSAILSNNDSNSLSISGASVKTNGNLVLQAKSFFSPRRPDGTAMTQNPGNTAGSPFDYIIEIKSELTTEVRTCDPGWS